MRPYIRNGAALLSIGKESGYATSLPIEGERQREGHAHPCSPKDKSTADKITLAHIYAIVTQDAVSRGDVEEHVEAGKVQ